MPSYDENSVLTLAGLKTALTRAKAETLAAIAAAGHLSKKMVDALPEAVLPLPPTTVVPEPEAVLPMPPAIVAPTAAPEMVLPVPPPMLL